MGGVVPLLPQYVFAAWCLVKHKDDFTFTFTFWTQYYRKRRVSGALSVE